MKIGTLTRRGALGVVAAFGLVAGTANATDAWPSKPITLVVPFAPGGTTDILARIVAQKLGEELHQTVIADNRAGAGGTLGANYAAHASADGNTFFFVTIAHAVAPGLYTHLPYDFSKNFDPVALVATTPSVLIVNPRVPAQNVKALIAYINANPGKVNFGSGGPGSTEHLGGELFRVASHTKIQHVPYKGGGPMMVDLMAGQIQMAVETSPSAYPRVKAGQVRALAVTANTRSPLYPGVPTLAEAGVKGGEMTTWYAVMAIHGTPAPIEQRMTAAVQKVLKDPEVQKKFEEQGVTPGDMGPPALSTFIQGETAKWGRIVKDSGITVE